jgi:EpsI family protein
MHEPDRSVQTEPEPASSGSREVPFLRRRTTIILTILLLAQAAVYYMLPRGQDVPLSQPLSEFPTSADEWNRYQEGYLDEQVLAVLKADDTLSRDYRTAGGQHVNLFVAYFRSQRDGRAPHSPKNCLPGSGWSPMDAGVVDVNLDSGRSIQVNRYLVTKGDNWSMVYYWYQSRQRVVASEYWAKFYLVADSLREHRTDTAIVRIVVPMQPNQPAPADQAATSFIRAVYPLLSRHLPS